MLKKILVLLVLFFTATTLVACQGQSNYDLAVEEGFEGSVQDYLNSLNGADGDSITIDDIYNSALEEGYEGTFLDFIDEYLSDTVSINTIMNYNLRTSVLIYSYFGESNLFQSTLYSSAGSGVFIELDKESGDAYIVTNYHVVYDSSEGISSDITVYIYGQEMSDYEIQATYIGGSMTNDIAVLKVENSSILKNSLCEAADIGDSTDTYAGDSIFTIGNPNGDGFSINQGVLSVTSEYIDIMASDDITELSLRVMRIDAAVNSGNSGGGLYDSSGRLIGIVNAKQMDVENISYAIPINVVYSLACKIINAYDAETGTINSIYKPLLGISTQISASEAYYDSTSQKLTTIQTIEVLEVTTGSVCTGKLMVGDILDSVIIDGETYEITTQYALPDLLFLVEKNDVITINVLRDNQVVSVEVILSNIVEIL